MTEQTEKTPEERLRLALRRTARGTGATACKAALALAMMDGADVTDKVQALIGSMGEPED